MPKFLVEHTPGKEFFEMPQAEGDKILKAVKAASTTDAYWVRSYMVPELGKVYCEWDAKDAKSIKQTFTKIGMAFDKISEAKIISSEDYR
jgi:hypothetical protein